MSQMLAKVTQAYDDISNNAASYNSKLMTHDISQEKMTSELRRIIPYDPLVVSYLTSCIKYFDRDSSIQSITNIIDLIQDNKKDTKHEISFQTNVSVIYTIIFRIHMVHYVQKDTTSKHFMFETRKRSFYNDKLITDRSCFSGRIGVCSALTTFDSIEITNIFLMCGRLYKMVVDGNKCTITSLPLYMPLILVDEEDDILSEVTVRVLSIYKKERLSYMAEIIKLKFLPLTP